MLIPIAAFFLVFGVFLASVTVALMAGQQRNRRSMSKVERKLDRIIDANTSQEEKQEESDRVAAIEEQNLEATSKYEYGGC